MNCKHNWCEGYTDPVDPQETEPIRICIKCGLIQGWKAWDAVWDEKSNYYLNRPTENKEQPANGSVAGGQGSTNTASRAIALLERAYKARIDNQWLAEVKTFLDGQRHQEAIEELEKFKEPGK